MKPIETAERTHSFRRHEHLARSDELKDSIYRIRDGWACRYCVLPDGRRQITALFLPGDYCEAQWMLSGRAELPVMALTEVRVTQISLANIHAKPGDDVMQLLGEVLKTFNRQTQWIISLGRKTAIERVKALMEELYDRMSQVARVANGSCSIPLTQQDIADIVGLTPVHVNRVLGDLRERESIRFTGKTLHLAKRAAVASAQETPQADPVLVPIEGGLVRTGG